MSKVRVNYCIDAGNEGLLLDIEPTATLMDLLNAWQPLCDQTTYRKKYATNQDQSCRGCQYNCCQTAYVIPDLLSFKGLARHTGYEYEKILDQYFDPAKRAIGLLRIRSNPCVFLQDQICTIYPLRTLICRFYLCLDISGDTEELIYHISAVGMAATHRFAKQRGLLGQKTAPLSSMDQLFLRLFDQYDKSPLLAYFLEAKTYQDVPLKPFLAKVPETLKQ